ncbi:MAG: hypothetical protein AAB443_00245 [Patescibacteria group bacterium]
MRLDFISILYGLIAFLSAFLLFFIEPAVNKLLLPSFGGSNHVWTTSMLFFQSILLIGYFYSFMLGKINLNKQKIVHIGLILGVFYLTFFSTYFPLTGVLRPSDISTNESFILQVFEMVRYLLIGVGIPFFLLSTTSVFLQNLYKFKKRDFYWIYGVSNFGSFAAILAYPFLIEPFVTLNSQINIWGVLLVFFVLLMLFLLGIEFKNKNEDFMHQSFEFEQDGVKKEEGHQKFKWVAISFLSSLMLLSTTSVLTLEIAPFPLLWLFPLALYLISFAFAFRKESLIYLTAFTKILYVTAAFYFLIIGINIVVKTVVIGLLLLSSLMVLHIKLFEKRPRDNSQVGAFYLYISFGSFLGSLFASVVAPLLFRGLWEFPIAIVVIYLYMLYILRDENSWLRKAFANHRRFAILLLYPIAAVFLILPYRIKRDVFSGLLFVKRNFYGVTRVEKRVINKNLHAIAVVHGATLHGIQIEDQNYKKNAIYYYTDTSGIGLASKYHSKRLKGKPLRIGVLGLGAGSIARFCQNGDFLKFYEINPVMEYVSNKYFSFIKDCEAGNSKVEIKMGDGRKSLEEELVLGEENFDILVLDAFNDDAIPMHLLTSEAFTIYKKHLGSNGIIVAHISNRHLDLSPALKKVAEFIDFKFVYLESKVETGIEGLPHIPHTSGSWVLLTKDEDFISSAEIKKAQGRKVIKDSSLFTDNFSNILSVIKL